MYKITVILILLMRVWASSLYLCYLLIFINIWFAVRGLNKYILYGEGISKGMQATQSVKWNEMYQWKDDMKYPGYEPELICAQG